MDPRTRAAVVSLALLCAAAALAQDSETAEPSLATLYGDLRSPTVLGTVPAPAKIEIGHAEIRPAAGTRLMVMGAAGEPCGWYFDGPGALVYTVEDPFSLPIARRNLKQADRIDVRVAGARLTVSTALRGAAVWGWEIDLGEMTPASGAEMTPPAWLREILDEKLTDNPERDMLLARWNREPEYRFAVFHAAGDDLLLDHDARPAVRTELLGRFDKVPPGSGPYSGRLGGEELAAQPLGRSWIEGNRYEVLAVDTDISLRAHDKDRLEVSTRSTLRFLRDGIRVLSMSLWSEVVDERQKLQRYEISRLLLDGKPAEFLHREGVLYVRLPEASRRNGSVELEVTVSGDVLRNPAGDNYWRLVTGWYPRPLYAGDERAEIRLTADVPAPWIAFAPGEIVERTEADGINRIRTVLRGPMERAAVLAGKYSSVTETQEGERVHVSSYASVKPSESERLARIILAIRGCLERWLGVPYPFRDLQVIEVNQWGWGQAPPGMIFITQEAFMTPARATLDEDTQVLAEVMTRGVNERIAHEVAHAWFPHVAKIATVEENWLSESLADYTSAYCLAESMGRRQGRYHWQRQLDKWKYWSNLAGDDSSVFLASHLANTEKDANAWRYLLYGRGPLVLHAVRQQLEKKHGEQEGLRIFLTWIRSYVANFKFKTAETRHLIGILEQMTGEDWQPFFDRHLIGTEPPDVKAR